MSRVDVYCNQLAETKQQGTIIVLEAENKLLELKISELEKIIDSNNENIKNSTEDKVKYYIDLNVKELELRIMDLGIKVKLNKIMITRINTSINNLKV